MEQSMFDTLLTLPLFQGLGRADLTRILESTHLRFETLPPESIIVQQDERCTDVTFVMEGTVKGITQAADRSWNIEEILTAPMAIGVATLYGSTQTHSSTFEALTSVRLLRVDKRTIAALTGYFEVFRINVLNMLSTTIARQRQPLWQPARLSLQGRIVQFLRMHVSRPAGRKIFHISQRTLGFYLGKDYRYISKALHPLEQRGLIELQRTTIIVPSFEKLIQAKL